MSVLNWRCWQHLETKFYPNLYALIFWWVSSAVIYWKVEWHRQKAKGGILSWVSSDVVLLCYIKLIAVVTWLMMSVAWYYVIVIANTAYDLSTKKSTKRMFLFLTDSYCYRRFVLFKRGIHGIHFNIPFVSKGMPYSPLQILSISI